MQRRYVNAEKVCQCREGMSMQRRYVNVEKACPYRKGMSMKRMYVNAENQCQCRKGMSMQGSWTIPGLNPVHLPSKSLEAMGLQNKKTRLECVQEGGKQTEKCFHESVVIQVFLNPIIRRGMN